MSAKLVQVGGATITLPWLPDSHEIGNLAAQYAQTQRPGRAPLDSYSAPASPTQRIEFILRQADMRESIADELAAITAFCSAKPLVRLVIGSHDYGAYRIADAGASITAYAADGSPARAEVMIDMRTSSSAVAKIGPVPAKAKRKKAKR